MDPEEIVVTVEEVHRAAKRINLGRAPGPDGIPGLVVKRAAIHCGRGLAESFIMLLRREVFPRAWKRTKLVFLKKKKIGDGNLPSLYRPICLLNEVGKLFERVVFSKGSDLGPTLWNIAYDRVLRVPLPGGSSVVCYADDTALLSAGRDLSCALLAAERDLDLIVNEFEGLGLKVALQKTEAMAFPASALCRRRIASPPVIRYMGGSLPGLNPESGRDPSVYWEDPSEPPLANGEEAASLQQRDPLHAPL
ncbi:PREDICTED: uncharacterized protein LOC106792897 [Polistes canadensis]|uniref:uncharacterized protein LOC106792897 n=1 Tax=Polistes canadensis TaxID=91411 RepID=UPI000718B39E|nr:PREDICTED: uncharacterized protein LOC106792897 [Polistes canadensis]